MRYGSHEAMGVPPEFHENGAPEYPVLPDEFNRFAPIVETERDRSRLRKLMLYFALAGILAVSLMFFPIAAAVQQEEPTEPQLTALIPVETEAPQITPTPSPTPAPTPEPLTGKIHIVVYSDILDIQAAMAGEPANIILAEETFDAETFDRYTLPALPTRQGYTAMGYVLFADNSEQYLIDLYFGRQQRCAIGSTALDGVVTAEDIRLVPLNDAGVHEAEVHTVWLENDSIFVLEFYDEALFGSYHVGFPMDSEGLVYLAAFPTPQRTGKTFVGWADSSENPVDTVTYFDFFEPLPDAQTLGDCDWSKDVPYRVYAMWEDGGEQIAIPAPQPDAQVIYYFTHSVCHGAVLLTDPANTIAVHVRLWDELVHDGVFEDDWTAEEIAAGKKEYRNLDINDFFGKHLAEYEAMGEYSVPEFEATVTYRDSSGTHTVTRSTESSAEEYVSVDYYDDGTLPNEYAFPGCFAAWAYDSQNEDLHFTADPNKKLDRGEICVIVTVDGRAIPSELCRVKKMEETYEYEGETFISRTYAFVMQRPDDFPLHGTAQITIRQSLVGFDYIVEYTQELDY